MAWLDPLPPDEGPCRCRECYGLVEIMEARTGKDYYALAGMVRPRPRHLPLTVAVRDTRPLRPACDGSMTCECPSCVRDRVQAARRRAGRVCLPWELDAA